MRYYVKINGVSSLTIPGLAIRELPSISKTLMRNQKETIDGRDGDLITELGYSAYDKTLQIGLFGTYDINQIIAFFNQKGTIVFSDEDDKYYNFTILDQIDYDRLVKFRTASVRIHCQPFKYPVSETPIEIEAEYVTATGEDITLNNTGVAPLEIGLKGNTSQETTTGKNLFDTGALSIVEDGGIKFTPVYENGMLQYINVNGTATANVFYQLKKITLPAGSYKINGCTGGGSNTYYLAINMGAGRIIQADSEQGFTLNAEATAVESFIRIGNGTQVTNIKIYPMIRLSSVSDSTYEPYTNGASPNPDYPQEVQVVTGDNTIKVVGKNLFDIGWLQSVWNSDYTIQVENGYTFSPLAAAYSAGKALDTPINLPVSISYKIKNGTGTNLRFRLWFDDGSVQSLSNGSGTGTTEQTITINNITKSGATKITRVGMDWSNAGTFTITNVMFNSGSTATTYTPYQSQEYEINLGTLELCKISTYQDYLYKSGENWYKHSEIGKITLNGSENWTALSALNTTNYYAYYYANSIFATPSESVVGVMSNYFIGDKRANRTANKPNCWLNNGTSQLFIHSPETTASNFQTWLGNNNTIVYYALATPTEEQITNAELIEQLEAILNAVSYEDQTNISQENDNLPFILDVSALKKGTDEAIINNGGNIYAKPIINIVGDGIVGVSLNGSQILSLDMTTYNDITIDTENMEAYDPNTSQLRNRQVTGDYSKLKLQPGNNTISLNGGFTSATITNWKRWL